MTLIAVLSENTFAARRAPGTLLKYDGSLRRLAQAGLVSASDASPDTLSRFVENRLETVEPDTAGADCLALFAVLGHLAESGRYDPAQIERLRVIRPATSKPHGLSASFMTHEQVERLAIVAAEMRSPLPGLTLRVACLSGLRAGELARLQWSDVDFAARVIRVRSTAEARTKTGRSRQVPLVMPLVDVLASHPGARLTRPGGRYVLSAGPAILPMTLNRRMQALSAAASFHVTLNLCRHTRASWWVQSGVPIAKVASWCGHSVDTATRFYIGLVSGYDPEADRLPAA